MESARVRSGAALRETLENKEKSLSAKLDEDLDRYRTLSRNNPSEEGWREACHVSLRMLRVVSMQMTSGLPYVL